MTLFIAPTENVGYGWYTRVSGDILYLTTNLELVKPAVNNTAIGGNLYFDSKEDVLQAIEEFNMPTLDLKDIYG